MEYFSGKLVGKIERVGNAPAPDGFSIMEFGECVPVYDNGGKLSISPAGSGVPVGYLAVCDGMEDWMLESHLKDASEWRKGNCWRIGVYDRSSGNAVWESDIVYDSREEAEKFLSDELAWHEGELAVESAGKPKD